MELDSALRLLSQVTNLKLLRLGLILGISISLGACGDKKDDARPDRGLFYLRVYHANPHIGNVNLAAEYYNVPRTLIKKNFSYSATFPYDEYLASELKIKPNEFGYSQYTLYAVDPEDSIINKSLPISILPDSLAKYSLFLYKNENNSAEFLLIKDNITFDNKDSTKASIRFVNVGRAEPLTLFAQNPNYQSAPVEFKSSSEFSHLKSDLYNFKCKDAAGNIVTELNQVPIVPGTAYTLYYDGDCLHQVKMISKK